MTRRDLFSKIGAFAAAVTAAGVPAHGGLFLQQPEPAFFTLRINRHLKPNEVARIQAHWEDLFKGSPPAPLLVLPPGMRISKVLKDSANGRVN